MNPKNPKKKESESSRAAKLRTQTDFPKPHPDIIDYEWERTPTTVKRLIEDYKIRLEEAETEINTLQSENDWFRDKLNKNKDTPIVSAPETILWSAIGVILTIGGTCLQAFTITPPWEWGKQPLQLQEMGVSYQIGAVLLTACLGGRYAGPLSQIIYIIIGLAWLPIFDRGGGWDYIQKPSFGYILGFVIGAWLCGYLAFKTKARLNRLALSCLAGLGSIHLIGIIYLVILNKFVPLNGGSMSIVEAIMKYTVYPLPGQLVIVCTVTLLAVVLRKIIFY